MTFDRFEKSISKIKKIERIGEVAHQKMSPKFRKKELEKINIDQKNPRKAGVMALFYPSKMGEAMFVLILRKTYKGVHSAQMGFPGGRYETQDKNLKQTALRETYEEIGVLPDQVEVLKEISKLYIPPSNFWVQPFIGICRETPHFIPQESEVEKIVEIKVTDFLDEANLITKNLSTSYATNVRVPAFYLNKQVVWGATAMMLGEVKEMLQQVL